MNESKYAAMIARLEDESVAHPRRYQTKVALLALLGLGVLLLIVGMAGLGLLLLAGIALAMLTSGGKLLLLIIKLGKLLFLMAVPLWMLIRSSFKALFVRLPAPKGRELQPHEAPALFDALASLRQRLGGPRFHHVLIVEEVNAAVVQRPAFGLLGWPRNYLLLGLPLMERMTAAQAMAVVAHEYGHLSGAHGHFGAFIYRLRLSWATIQSLAEQWSGLSGRLLQRIIGWYAPYFNAYTFVLARANEYQADRCSADLVGASVAADALKLVNLAGPQYEAFLDATLAQIREQPRPPTDLPQKWAALEAPDEQQAQRWLQQALQREVNPHDTHPRLLERLRALGSTQGDEARLPDTSVTESAAHSWLGQGLLARLREESGNEWADRVHAPWAERHQEYEAQRQELQQLAALQTPDITEQRRLIQLRQSLEPAFDAVGAYAAFNALHANDAPGLFGEGAARLELGDEQGLALLEQALQLDRAACSAVCARALAFLEQRGVPDPRIATYRERWQQHEAWLSQLQSQMDTLDPQHELEAAELPDSIREPLMVALQRRGNGIAKAYWARRILPADPSQPSFLLGVELSWWAAWRKKDAKVIEQLAQLDWPVHVIVCTLRGQYKPLKRRLSRLPQARLR